MTDRKSIEIGFYDNRYKASSAQFIRGANSQFIDNQIKNACSSYRYAYQWLIGQIKEKKVLDFGCGAGVNSIFMARGGAYSVIGLDLSASAIEIAKTISTQLGIKNIDFVKGDCEKTPFDDESFDLIFDSGTLSCLDLETALLEINRILKPNGYLICVETFGHHPLANLKRRLNLIAKRRTEWAVQHIFKMDSLRVVEKYFERTTPKFFHLISYITIPWMGHPIIRPFGKTLELVDYFLMKIPFLKKFGFKIVIIAQKISR